jgi:hypothetical protein
MNIQSICSSPDWFFVHEGSQGQLIVYRVAAWGLTEEGQVYGLVSHQEMQDRPVQLVPVPAIPGAYRHKDELSEEQLKAASQVTKIPQ